jgi:hypothetical protein
MAQQTAVEQLINYMKENFHLTDESLKKFEEAKEIEKQQHSETWHDSRENTCIPFEDYYNETYTTRLQNETN